MKKFGIYIFNLSKDNPSTGILSTDTMVGEVDMSSKAYEGLSVEDACKKRIADELSAKAGMSFYTMDDVCSLKTLAVEADKENHIDSFLREEIVKRTLAQHVRTTAFQKTELLRDITVDEVYDEICKVYNPEARRTHSYGLREYQQQIVDKAACILQNHKEVLINLSTRGGKSFVSLELAKKINAQNILILTPYPAAESSFRSEIECHTDFAGWKFYTKDDISSDTEYQFALNCVFLSFAQHWQELNAKEQNDENKLVKLISQIDFDTVIIDETHTTSASYRSSQILETIPHKHEIHLSGTPYNDLMSGRFNKDNTVTLDFIDLINWDKAHHDVGFPELKINLISNMKKLNEKLAEYDPDAFTDDADFSFEKAFGDPADKTHKRAIAFAKWLFAQGIFSEHKHYLVFVPSVKIAKMLPAVFKAIQAEFAVMGLNDEDIGSCYEKEINDFEQRHAKTIIVTCAKCTTGVTLRRCDAIVLLKRMNSAETFVQTLFRCMTPYEGKTKAALYELDSEAAYKIVREVAAVHNELHAPKQSTLDTYRELLASVAIESWEGEKIEFKEELATQFLEKVKSIPTYYNMEEVFSLDNISSLLTRTEQLALLESSFGKTDKAKAQFIVAQNEAATGLKSKSYGKRELDETQAIADGNGTVEVASKNDSKKLIEQIKKFLLNLDWEILLNDFTTFEQLYDYRAPEWNDALQSVYKKILKANRRSVTDFIEQYTQITLEKAKNDPDKMLELINKLSPLNGVDFRTPTSLVDKMLDKLGATNYDGSYILDPCCGTGTMLFQAMKRGWPKDHLIGTDIEPKFVNILNKLGFNNVFVKNVLDEDYGEFVKEKIENSNMKIIGNPPYGTGSNLARQIIDKLSSMSDECVWLAPNKAFKNSATKITDFEKVRHGSEAFDAGLGQLIIADIKRQHNNGKTFEDIILDTNAYELHNAIEKYNKTHQSSFVAKRIDGKDRPALKENELRIGSWAPAHGYMNESDGLIGITMTFKDAQSKDNFKKWGVCTGATKNEHELAYECLDIMSQLYGGCCGGNIADGLPHVDWSREWTDEQIYEELGIDLKKKTNIVHLKDVCSNESFEDFIKDKTGNNSMKIIMNPPYDKNLHLNILDKVSKDFPNAEIVNLSPVGWLQDPLAPYKRSAFNKYENLKKHIEDINIITQENATVIFQALQHEDLGIYKVSKEGGFDTETFIRKYESFVKKIKNYDLHWSDKVESQKIDGIRVKTQALRFSAPSATGKIKSWTRLSNFDKFMLMYDTNIFIDGKKDGKWWTEWSKAKNKYSKNIGDPLVDSIKFDTLEEAQNFEAFAKTKFMTFCNRVSKVGVNTDFSFLPFMPTYKHPWTDELLYKYFNLTDDEVNIIEKEMA